jgi:uncharacterized protein YciI
MSKFVFILKDKNPSVLTKQIYYSHVAHIRRCMLEGKLFLAGPLVGQDRILQIVEAASRNEAEQTVEEDPYIIHKHYEAYEVYEMLESNEKNNWLMDTPRIQNMLRNLP